MTQLLLLLILIALLGGGGFLIGAGQFLLLAIVVVVILFSVFVWAVSVFEDVKKEPKKYGIALAFLVVVVSGIAIQTRLNNQPIADLRTAYNEKTGQTLYEQPDGRWSDMPYNKIKSMELTHK